MKDLEKSQEAKEPEEIVVSDVTIENIPQPAKEEEPLIEEDEKDLAEEWEAIDKRRINLANDNIRTAKQRAIVSVALMGGLYGALMIFFANANLLLISFLIGVVGAFFIFLTVTKSFKDTLTEPYLVYTPDSKFLKVMQGNNTDEINEDVVINETDEGNVNIEPEIAGENTIEESVKEPIEDPATVKAHVDTDDIKDAEDFVVEAEIIEPSVGEAIPSEDENDQVEEKL